MEDTIIDGNKMNIVFIENPNDNDNDNINCVLEMNSISKIIQSSYEDLKKGDENGK